MLAALKAFLLPAYNLELGTTGVVSRTRRMPKTAHLVRIGRGVCRHTSYPRVAKASFVNERQAIRLKAQATAPFHNSDFAILWGTQRVSVFFWDRDRVAAELREAGVALTDQTILMPSNFFEPAGRDIELRSHDDGFELQVWDGGALQLSRWWQIRPTSDQIANLLEPLELGRVELSAIDTPTKSSVHPIRMSWRNLPDYITLFRSHFIVAAVVGNVAVAAYALGGLMTVWHHQEDLAARQSSIKPYEVGVVEARKQAIESGRWLEAYEVVRGPRRHTPLMVAFLSTMESSTDKFTLQAWEYDNGRLAVTLQMKADLDVRQLVKALEMHRLFRSVNAESNAAQNNVRLTMTVVPGGKP